MKVCRIVITGSVLILLWVGSASAATRGWDNDSGDNRWLNPANWSGDALPTYIDNDTATFQGTATNVEYAVIDDFGAEAGTLHLGRNGSDATLEMTGGELRVRTFNMGNTDGGGASIDDLSVTGSTVTLDLSGLTPGASNTVGQATMLEPQTWTNVDGFVSTTTSTNWSGAVNGTVEFWRLESPRAVGEGTLLLSGGAVTIGNDTGNSLFTVGDGPGARASVTMSGGSISIQTLGDTQNHLFVGDGEGSTGNFTMTGGMLDVAEDIRLGSGANASGSLSISNAMVTVGDAITLGSAPGATGRLTMKAGATLDINSTANNQVGGAIGAQGHITVSGGTLALLSSHLYLGTATNSTGTLTVSGGDLEINPGSKNIEVGREPGARGVITVSSGSLTTKNFQLAKSAESTGEFNVSGGEVTVNNNFELAKGSGATGIVTVTGGELALKQFQTGDAVGGVGIINISGGTVSNWASLFLGNSGRGIMNLEGGTLRMAGNQFRLPNNGYGELNMTGGDMLIPNTDFRIGHTGEPRTGMVSMVTGILECKNFTMNTGAVVRCTIDDGVIYDDYILDGTNDMARIQSYVDDGVLVAAQAGEVIHIDLTTDYTNSLGNVTNHMIWAGPP